MMLESSSSAASTSAQKVALVRDCAVVIPTFNAGSYIESILDGLDKQQGLMKDQVYVVDSSSTDGTAERFEKWGANVLRIPQSEFDHGGTRRLACSITGQTKYIVFLTQDAIPYNSEALARLLSAFLEERVALAYGCQLPRQGANAIEAHARKFNYPEDHVYTRSRASIAEFGMRVVFCSDSFAAYRRDLLDGVGGMPESAYFAEDQIVAAKLVAAGYQITYRGDAKVVHSHAYSSVDEFKRYFDVGVFHARNLWILNEFGGAEGHGLDFVRSEFAYLRVNAPWKIPEAILRVIMKYAGYRSGRLERFISPRIKQYLSMSSYYWARVA